MENVLYYFFCVCASSVPLVHLTVTLMRLLMRSLVGLSFRERIAESKCVWARSQAVSSELLRQFSACRPLNCELNTQY